MQLFSEKPLEEADGPDCSDGADESKSKEE